MCPPASGFPCGYSISAFSGYVSQSGNSVAAVAIEQSRTEQETRSEESHFFALHKRNLLTG
jgi:hypothetical protein